MLRSCRNLPPNSEHTTASTLHRCCRQHAEQVRQQQRHKEQALLLCPAFPNHARDLAATALAFCGVAAEIMVICGAVLPSCASCTAAALQVFDTVNTRPLASQQHSCVANTIHTTSNDQNSKPHQPALTVAVLPGAAVWKGVYSGCPAAPGAPLPLPLLLLATAPADADAPIGPAAAGPLLNDVDVTLEPPGMVVVVTDCWSPIAEPDAMLLPSGAMLVMEMPGGAFPKAVTVVPSGLTYV